MADSRIPRLEGRLTPDALGALARSDPHPRRRRRRRKRKREDREATPSESQRSRPANEDPAEEPSDGSDRGRLVDLRV